MNFIGTNFKAWTNSVRATSCLRRRSAFETLEPRMMLAVGSGGVIIDGGDRDDHGSSAVGPDNKLGTADDINQDGWKYIEQMVNFAYSNSQNGRSGILVVGATGQKALTAITSVATVLHLPLVVATKSPASGQIDLSTVDFDAYAMLYVPSSAPETTGGLSATDLGVLTSRKLDVQNFINRGGSLVALTEHDFAQPYSWLELPELFTTDDSSNDTQYQTQALIDAKLVISNAELHNGTPLHNSFTGPIGFNGLLPFVYNIGSDGKMGTDDDEVITLGLGKGSKIGNPPVAVDDAATTPFGTSISIAVLANDFGIDSPINMATVAIVDQPQHGTVQIDPSSRNAIYKPDATFVGDDTFTYTFADEEGAFSRAAIVTIHVGEKPTSHTRTGRLVSPPTAPLPDPPIEPKHFFVPSQQSFLLLLLARPIPLTIDPSDIGSAGIVIEKKSVSAPVSSPQVVDAAFGSDEVDKSALLANFLDFVEPEMVIVDLGDEPPAKITMDVSHGPPTAINTVHNARPTDATNDLQDSGAPTNGPGKTITVLKPPQDEASVVGKDNLTGVSITSPMTKNWRWFAGGGALLLLAGAAWSGRSKWLRFTRKLRSR